jgi:hypothetical protein
MLAPQSTPAPYSTGKIVTGVGVWVFVLALMDWVDLMKKIAIKKKNLKTTFLWSKTSV